MRGCVLVGLALALCPLAPALGQSPTSTIAQVDARAEVAAVLFAASATQAAAERVADAKMRAQRQEIDGLRTQVRGGAAQLRTALTTAEENYVAALAARDRAYAQEIAVFRAGLRDIAATPEGAAALARYNAGDRIGALAVLDDLTAAEDKALQKRIDIERAAPRRRTAILALDMRAKGELTTAQLITRFEEVTRLDPGVFWDWIELGRLYNDAGKLPDALHAAKGAADTAADNRDRSVALDALGDVQAAQGNLPAALASYQASLAIAERLATADPSDAGRQRDLSVSYENIGDVQVAQGQLPGAQASYQASLAIRERLAQANPGNTVRQRDLSVSHVKIGDVQLAQGDLPAALVSYRESHTIFESLAKAEPGNAEWQRNLSVSDNKIGNVQVAQGGLPAALASFRGALTIAERLAQADPGNAEWQRDLSVSHIKIGDVQVAQGDLPAALESYQARLAIAERLAQADPGHAQWQRDLSASYVRIGNVQKAQGDLTVALASYRASLAIAERLTKADPGNANWQRELSMAHTKIGDVQKALGDLAAALASYRASLAIEERLANSAPSNAQWQRDLIVGYVKLSEVTGDKAYAAQARDIALDMQKRGILAPSDTWMIEELKRRAGP
jgi:tetratricopeptide (TPR) repeat protein